jgi:hypothetical protein
MAAHAWAAFEAANLPPAPEPGPAAALKDVRGACEIRSRDLVGVAVRSACPDWRVPQHMAALDVKDIVASGEASDAR